MKTNLIVVLFVALFCTSAVADLIISTDASSPISNIVIEASVVNLATFKLTADESEALVAQLVTVAVTNGPAINNVSLWSVAKRLGDVQRGNDTVVFSIPDGQMIVQPNTFAKITVKIDTPIIDGLSVVNGMPFRAALLPPDAVCAVGYDSAFSVNSDLQSAYGSEMVLYQTRPYFSLASESPSGEVSGAISLLAVFDVTADAIAAVNGVEFDEANGNTLTVNINGNQHPDGTPNLFFLKDQTGTTLDTVSIPDSATNVTFDFSQASMFIPTGGTEKLFVYGDVTDYAAIQLWLDDSDPDNIGWGIYGGNYHEADKIFRGDIYAGVLTNPSVPEPSTMALLIAALIVGGVFLRRKK